MTDPAELRRRARFLFIAAILVDLAAVAVILLPVLQGQDVMTTLPIAIVLFMGSSGLILASVFSRRKADAAE